MGGGPSTTTTRNMPNIPGWLTGPAQNYVGLLGGLATNSPYDYQHYNPLMNPGVAPFSPLQQSGMADIVGANPAFSHYAGTGLDTLANLAQTGGGMNPFLQQYSDAASDSLVKQYRQATGPSEMSDAMKAGAFGGSGDAEQRALNQFSLGQNLANLNAQIYEPAWQHQLDTQLSAAGQLPGQAGAVYQPGMQELGIGNQQQAQAQNFLNAITQGATQSTEWPYKILGQLGGGLSSMLGPFSGSTTISPNMGASGFKL